MDHSALEKINAKRQELDDSIARLRKSLRHWQTLELDYEGLREEFEVLKADVSEDKCLEVARDFKPEALDEKDLRALIRDAVKHSSDRPRQLAHTLSKRVDYVTRNVETLRSRLEGEQKKLNAILLAQDPDTRDEAGLPLGDIIEELDDSGKVISGKIEHTGREAAGLAEILEKAGVEGLMEKGGKVTAAETETSVAMLQPEALLSSPSVAQPSLAPSSTHQQSLSTTDLSSPTPFDRTSQKVERDPDADSDKPSVSSSRVNEAEDTAEEAELRQEMLNYDANTMRAVVAELYLDEDASDVSYDDDSDNPNLIIDSENEVDDELEDDSNSDDDEEEEGETGATKRLHLSSEYKRQMEELQNKLGLRDMKNLGPEPALPDNVQREIDRLNTERPKAAEAARKAALKRAQEIGTEDNKDLVTSASIIQSKPKAEKGAKKKVAFSNSIDVADEKPSLSATHLPSRPKSIIEEVNPVNDTVLERSSSLPTTTSATSAPSPAPAPKSKVSRFKVQRTSVPPPASPTPPTDRLVATKVLERPTPSASTAPDPQSIDDELHRKQQALEQYKIQSRQIHQQGGYVKHHLPGQDDDDDNDDGDDDWYTKDPETGAVRKLSKFKAARLK